MDYYLFKELGFIDKINYLKNLSTFTIVDAIDKYEDISILDFINEGKKKIDILLRVKYAETKYKKEFIEAFKSVYDFYYIITNIYLINSQEIRFEVLKSLPKKFKLMRLGCITDFNKILELFNYDELLENYFDLDDFTRDKIIRYSMSNKEYKAKLIEYYIKLPLNQKGELLGTINRNNEELSYCLINLMDDSLIQDMRNFNEPSIKQYNSLILRKGFDPNITIGVELEARHQKYNSKIKYFFENLYNNWKVVGDGSLPDGFETISPILTYNKKSLLELKNMCSILEDNGFYTDNYCGGHIHLGVDYFKNSGELITFISLFGVVEDILFAITNRKGNRIRNNVTTYASPIQDDLDIIDKIEYEENRYREINTFGSNLISRLILQQGFSRYKSLNLLNIIDYTKHTVEIRVPNGEIDFNEVLLNIELFLRMFQVSKIIYNEANKYYLDLYNEIFRTNNIKERFEILMKLLFTEDKELECFNERYNENIILNQEIIDFDVKRLDLLGKRKVKR